MQRRNNENPDFSFVIAICLFVESLTGSYVQDRNA